MGQFAQVTKTALLALGAGFVLEIVNSWSGSEFLHTFLTANLVTLLVALLAINGATMGVVLTKIRDLVDKSNSGSSMFFQSTRAQMLLSVKEQLGLIVVSVFLLGAKGSPYLTSQTNAEMLLNSACIGTFVYALLILYDVAKGVLIIVDFDG